MGISGMKWNKKELKAFEPKRIVGESTEKLYEEETMYISEFVEHEQEVLAKIVEISEKYPVYIRIFDDIVTVYSTNESAVQ